MGYFGWVEYHFEWVEVNGGVKENAFGGWGWETMSVFKLGWMGVSEDRYTA